MTRSPDRGLSLRRLCACALLGAVFKENRKVLKEMVQSSNRLFEEARDRKYGIMPTLRRLQQCDIDTGHFYVQVVDYLSEVTTTTRGCRRSRSWI